MDGMWSNDIKVDNDGNAYIYGYTLFSAYSSNLYLYPTTPGAYRTNYYPSWGHKEFYVTKLNSSGTALVYSTFINESSGVNDIQSNNFALDNENNVIFGGSTSSLVFPVTPGVLQTTLKGAMDGFITKLNSTGSALIFSTYLGGSGL